MSVSVSLQWRIRKKAEQSKGSRLNMFLLLITASIGAGGIADGVLHPTAVQVEDPTLICGRMQVTPTNSGNEVIVLE